MQTESEQRECIKRLHGFQKPCKHKAFVFHRLQSLKLPASPSEGTRILKNRRGFAEVSHHFPAFPSPLLKSDEAHHIIEPKAKLNKPVSFFVFFASTWKKKTPVFEKNN